MTELNVVSYKNNWNYLKDRTYFISRAKVLELAVNLSCNIPGNIIEFGVARGESTRTIRKILTELESNIIKDKKKRIFACDSFKGLPEKYEDAEIGTYACQPPKIANVEIIEGYFKDSLNSELAKKVNKISFAFFDADLYSSTLCALQWTTPLLHNGSLLLFDEFLGGDGTEKRAFEKWSEEYQVTTVKIAEFLREPIDKRVLFQVIQTK